MQSATEPSVLPLTYHWCGVSIDSESACDAGCNQRKSAVAPKAPANWAAINAGASAGRIPANVFVTERATVTAGFANDVDAVNQ